MESKTETALAARKAREAASDAFFAAKAVADAIPRATSHDEMVACWKLANDAIDAARLACNAIDDFATLLG